MIISYITVIIAIIKTIIKVLLLLKLLLTTEFSELKLNKDWANIINMFPCEATFSSTSF